MQLADAWAPAPQVCNSGSGWLPADRGPLLAYPPWLAGEWRVARVRLQGVAFPLGQRYVNRLTPGATCRLVRPHVCAAAGNVCMRIQCRLIWYEKE